jgi:hypothetical protein
LTPNSRSYINRFCQPDTIIPDLSNPQSWNRYAYTQNDPVNRIDPDGHRDQKDCYNCEGGGWTGTEDPLPPEKQWTVKGKLNKWYEEHPEFQPQTLYRSMKEDENGLPTLGESGRALGVRGVDDIPIDADGLVHPGTGGMSVSPNNPMNLPEWRRPSGFGGTGKDPVWGLNSDDLGTNLSYRPDPENPIAHGFVEPAFSMTYDQYLESLWNTLTSWFKLK